MRSLPQLNRIRPILAVSVALFALRAGAQPSMEERLQKLEGQVSALQTENADLRKALGVDGRTGQTVVVPGGREPTLAIGGLVQAQGDFGEKGDSRFATANDRFYLRRVRLNATGRFLEEFDFRVELDLSNSLAETAALRAQLTDAYINWNRYDFANLKFGQFKTPFGYEQLYSDPKLLTIERSLVNDRLTVGRQIGTQVSGDLLDKRLSYAAGVFNGTGVNTSANDNNQFMWVGRVAGTAWQGRVLDEDTRWSLGVNALTSKDTAAASQPTEFGFDVVPGGAKDNIFTGSRLGEGVDTQLHLGRLDLWAEYLRTRFRPTDQIPYATFASDGWDAQLSFFLVPKELQSVLKYDTFDPDLKVSANSTSTWTLGLNWFLKGDDLKVQLDYLRTHVDGQAAHDDKILVRIQTIF